MSDHEFDEKSLERALQAPGSPAELNGEGEYLAMFRAARSAGPVPVAPPHRAARRAARRLGTSSTLAAVFTVATVGVAAAYSSNLPNPVQRAVHSVLSPLGVPAAEPHRPVAEPQPQRSPEPSQQPTAASVPSPSPSGPVPPVGPSRQPSASTSESTDPSMEPSMSQSTSTSPASPESATTSTSASPSPSDSPSDSPSGTPSGTPTDPLDASSPASPTSIPSPTSSPAVPDPPVTPTTVTPAAVSISSAGAGQRVAPGGTAIVSGRVAAADGSPAADVRVVLQAHGPSGWRRLAVARSASDGSVSVASGPVTQTTIVRLRAERVLSAPRQLIVQPTLAVSATTNGAVATIAATSAGGPADAQVQLLTWRNGRWVTEQRGRLDSAGGVRFDVPAPAGARTYVVRLAATASHAAAEARVTVSPPPTSVTMP